MRDRYTRKITQELLKAIERLHAKAIRGGTSDKWPALKEGKWYLFWMQGDRQRSKRIRTDAELKECIDKYNRHVIAEWLLSVAKYTRENPPQRMIDPDVNLLSENEDN